MARVRAERDCFVGFVLEVVEDFPAEHRLAGHARFIDDHRLQVGDDTVVEAARDRDRHRLAARLPVVARRGRRSARDQRRRVRLAGSARSRSRCSAAASSAWSSARRCIVSACACACSARAARSARSATPRSGTTRPRTFAAEFPFDPDAKVGAVRRRDGKVEVMFTDADGGERTERFECLLAATGRRPNVDRLGLENTGLELDDKGVPVFDRFTGQCGDSHIFIAGDADDDVPLLHEAADEGKIAGDNAGRYPDVRAQRRRAPLGIVFSDPQIAIVGRSWRELQAERRRPRDRRGVVRGSGPQPGDQPEPGPAAPVRRPRHRPVPGRRDDRPGAPSTSATCSPGRRSRA